MANITGEILEKSNRQSQDFKNKSQSVGSSLERITHDIGARAGEATSSVVEKATEYVNTSREYVKENPAKSVAIAAAAGAVAGSILTLVMRRRH